MKVERNVGGLRKAIYDASVTTKGPSEELLTPARLAHLSMIQGIILRLSGFSANAKNFCITILAALIGVSFQHHVPLLCLAASFAIFVFAALDTYYLAQERRFRDFYEEVAARPIGDARQLSMAPGKLSFQKFFAGLWSFSTGGFYLLLLIVAAALLSIAYGRSDEPRLGGASGASAAPEQRTKTDATNFVGGAGTIGGKPKSEGGTAAGELAVPNGDATPTGSVRSTAVAGPVEPVRKPTGAATDETPKSLRDRANGDRN